jgi:hypothetical protein
MAGGRTLQEKVLVGGQPHPIVHFLDRSKLQADRITLARQVPPQPLQRDPPRLREPSLPGANGWSGLQYVRQAIQLLSLIMALPFLNAFVREQAVSS